MPTIEPTTDTRDAQHPAASAAPGRSRKRFELLEECRELILQRLTEVIAQALTRMSDELTAEALRTMRSDQQQALLDAVMLVREHRMEIEGRFRRSFADIFERRMFAMNAGGATAPQADGDGPSASELQLVSDEAIDDRINVDRLVGKARSRLDPDEVLGIRARLGALLERDWFDEARHPASPEAVFEALRTSLAELSPRPEVKVALLHAFEPHVSQNLNGIYATVNQRLRANHVLPRIRPQVKTSGATTRRGPETAASPAAAGAAAGAGAPAAASPHGAGYAIAGWVPGPGHAGAGWSDGAAAAAAVDGYGAIPDPIAALHRAMADASAGRAGGRAHVARMLRDPATFGVADIPVAPVERPLVASLTALQRDAGPADGAALLPALVERVREQGSPLDRITVEIVSMVFDYIYADRRLPDAIKQQLLRLQVVAVKAALLDRSFFARRQHPMRRLIDRISDVGADPDADASPGAPLIVGLAGVVDRVLEEFDADLAVFDRALEAIDACAREEAERHAARIEAVAREAAARETHAVAQDAARAELSRRLAEDSPPFVRAFLERWWTEVLARLRTSREGEDADRAWATGLRTADYLIWSVAPKQVDEIPRLAAVLPGLIRGLRQGLELARIEPGEHAAFFDELLRAHTLEIAAAKQRAAQLAPPPEPPVASPLAVRMQVDGTVRFEPPAEPTRRVRAATTASDELLSPLARGQRIEVTDDAGAKVFKLAWISPARQLFILTRHPDESLTLKAPELAFMVQRGQARVAPEDSALDRAIRAVAGDAPAAPPGAGEAAAARAETLAVAT